MRDPPENVEPPAVMSGEGCIRNDDILNNTNRRNKAIDGGDYTAACLVRQVLSEVRHDHPHFPH